MDKIYKRLEFHRRTYPKFFHQAYVSKFILENGGDIPESDLFEVLQELVNEAIKNSEGDMDDQTLRDRMKINFILNGYGLGNKTFLQLKIFFHRYSYRCSLPFFGTKYSRDACK